MNDINNSNFDKDSFPRKLATASGKLFRETQPVSLEPSHLQNKQKQPSYAQTHVMSIEMRDKANGCGFLVVFHPRKREIRTYRITPEQNKLLRVIRR